MLRKKIKNCLICGAENDYHPYFLRKRSVGVLALLAIIIFLFSLLHNLALKNTDFLAAVLPAVLTDLTNESREIYDISNLTVNPLLEKAARLKAEDMARKGYFAHNSPEGFSPWYWFELAGYKFLFAGENLAVHFSDSMDVNRAWLASAGHRANILDPNFSEIGIAVAEGFYEGVPSTFVVQMFGRPFPVKGEASTVLAGPIEEVRELESSTSIADSSPEESFDSPDPIRTSYYTIGGASSLEELSESLSLPEAREVREAKAEASTFGARQYAGLSEELFSSPKTLLSYLYLFLTLVILLILVLALSSGVGKHRHTHIGSAVFLLILIVILFTAYNYFVLESVVII